MARASSQTNVTMDAEDMLLRRVPRHPRSLDETRALGRLGSARSSATTAPGRTFYGGPGELSTTIEGYWALRLAEDSADEPHMLRAAAFVRDHGGIERARVFTHVWLALFGLWPWEQVPALPPEIVLLPRWLALNVYDFACWARQTIVALSLVKAHRPVHPLGFGLDELRSGEPAHVARPRSWRARLLVRLDRLMRAYERRPLGPLRWLALGRAERWVVRRQEADGSWGGIQPPWVYSLMALHLAGYPLEHPVMRRGLEGLERFMVEDVDDARGVGAPPGPSRRLEACQSPVWDTALALIALADAGVAGDEPALVHGAEWLLGEEVGGRRRLGRRAPRPAAGRLGVRVRQRQLSRR